MQLGILATFRCYINYVCVRKTHLPSSWDQVRMKVTSMQTLRSEADPRGGGHEAMPPIIRYFFSKARFLMSFQIYLDLIIDLNNHIYHAMYIVLIHSQSELSVMYISAAL